MKYRKVRIAWSAVWGAMAVLVVVLWVRSYQIYTDFNPVGQLWVAWWYGSMSITSRPSIDAYFTQYRGSFPCWLPVMVSISLVPIAWIPERFSLRTLLVATALVAIVLGVIMAVV